MGNVGHFLVSPFDLTSDFLPGRTLKHLETEFYIYCKIAEKRSICLEEVKFREPAL